MKLNQALTKLKNLKSKIARVETCISESAVHYEDAPPQYDYQVYMANRLQLIQEIRDLKTRVQLTNATATTEYDGRPTTIAELILINADLRSDMAFVNKQLALTTESESRWSGGRSKDEIRKVFASGYDKQKFHNWLNDLEKEKEKLDEVLANANASTDLV